ncbi:uncharacterized protein V6R79_001631 [Siganus canaliculatus]
MASHHPELSSSGCVSSDDVVTDLALSYLFFITFPIALLLNGVAAWVSLHLPSSSTFIVYVKNLVAADLLMTLMLPLIAASQLPGAAVELQMFDCRYSRVIFYCCLYTSITLMGLISLDRFFKIVRPGGKLLGQSVLFGFVMSTLVWVVLFGATGIPTVILTDQNPVGNNSTMEFCMSLKSPAGLVFHKYVVLSMESLFWLVSILIVFCYICITIRVLQSYRNSGSNNSDGKKKVKLRVFLILLVFFVCFVPLHIMRVPLALNENLDGGGCTEIQVLIAHNFALWVSTTNACLDPFLYIYLCREYKDKLVHMMKSAGICVSFYSNERSEDS